MDRKRRMLLALALLLLFVGAGVTAYYVDQIKTAWMRRRMCLCVADQRRTASRPVRNDGQEWLDGPGSSWRSRATKILSGADSASTHRFWRAVLSADLLFIAGYVLFSGSCRSNPRGGARRCCGSTSVFSDSLPRPRTWSRT